MFRTNLMRLILFALLFIQGCATTGTQTGEEKSSAAAPAGGEAVAAKEVVTMSAAEYEALQTLLEVMRAGEWPTARELAQELILNYPTLPEAYANMGNIELQLGAIGRAEQAWRKALELRPGWAPLYNRLGLFYREQGRFSEALSMYDQALAVDEGYAKAHRNIAILYEIYLGDGASALPHYRRYQELTGGAEQEVAVWIADLERRVGEGSR